MDPSSNNQPKQINPPDQLISDPSRKDSIVSDEKPQQDAERLEQRKKQDAKSIFIQNVDYKSTKQQLQAIFQDCGTITRITILKDSISKQAKGCAYMSFQSESDVQMALNLTGIKLRGRMIKVKPKRTNIVGMNKKSEETRKMQVFNEMMMRLTNHGFRGKPRGRGRGG